MRARFLHTLSPRDLYHYLFDLIERDLVTPAVVELGRPRAFVRGHLLDMFEQPAVLEIDGDADDRRFFCRCVTCVTPVTTLRDYSAGIRSGDTPQTPIAISVKAAPAAPLPGLTLFEVPQAPRRGREHPTPHTKSKEALALPRGQRVNRPVSVTCSMSEIRRLPVQYP